MIFAKFKFSQPSYRYGDEVIVNVDIRNNSPGDISIDRISGSFNMTNFNQEIYHIKYIKSIAGQTSRPSTPWYQLVLIHSDFGQLPLQRCCEHLDGSIFMIYSSYESHLRKLTPTQTLKPFEKQTFTPF